jgi:transcriptional regulator with XRE-family HTH domain
MNVHSPSALRWLIGTELRRYRRSASLAASAAAALLNCAESKISHMESGRYRQSPEDVAALMSFYKAGQVDADRLVSLAARDDESTWWAPFSDIVPDWLQTFVGLEHLADSEFTYEPLVLPGLLQIEDYAAALTASSRRVRPDRAHRFVEFRLSRQARLFADSDRPLTLTAIAEESALRRPIGSVETRLAQWRYLLELNERANITFQVLPSSLPSHAGLGGRFTLLEFNGSRSIGFVEMQEGGVYLQDQDEVATYTMSAESLRRDALNRHDTNLLITSLISELS